MNRVISGILTLLLLLPCFTLTLFAEQPEELTFIFQKQKDPTKVKKEADLLAQELATILGMPVKTRVPNNYASAVQALVSNKAEIAYLDSVSYLLAQRDGNAEVLLVEERESVTGEKRTDYDSLILAPKDSELNNIKDLISKAKDLHFVFTSPTSTSGYIMPYRELVNQGLVKAGTNINRYFKKVNFAGSYAQAMQQVLRQRGDICAVSFYAYETDSAKRYLKQSERDKLKVIARIPGVPTHVIAIRGDLDDGLKQKIKAAILKISSDHAKLLRDIYGTAQFKTVDAFKHLAPTLEALQYLNLPIENFVKK